MNKIELMTTDGYWFLLNTWVSDPPLMDANDWLFTYRDRIGSGSAPYPGGHGMVDLSLFAGVRGTSNSGC